MNLQLIIDTKEKATSSSVIKSYLENQGVICISQPLAVGDYAVIDTSIQDQDNVILLLERKTCKDIAASIGDGRYREQKTRLMNHPCRWKGYLMEGIYPDDGILVGNKRVAKTTFYSVISGITLRDGLIVYMCQDLNSSAQMLGQIIKKLPEYLKADTGQPSYAESLIKSVSTVRKENMTPEVCYLAQLCQIPGVSHRIASKIQEHYPGMRQLVSARECDLSEIDISDGTKRRLGSILAARICQYISPPVSDSASTTTIKAKIVPVIKKKAVDP